MRQTTEMMVNIKLLDLLKEKGFSQRGFARESGIRYATVNDMCTNDVNMLSMETLALICDLLECQPAEILEVIPKSEAHIINRKKKKQTDS